VSNSDRKARTDASRAADCSTEGTDHGNLVDVLAPVYSILAQEAERRALD
jgi:hypothetical protein